jgi:CDP-diacylglycerol--serine O-phosphatidyltransferase
MKHIPNILTSANLIFGFIAVVFAANGDITSASWLILVAMIFDFLDGLSARMLKAYSPLGKELDSLADVVSFGVAPAMIIFYLLRTSLQIDDLHSYDLKTILSLLVPAIMPVFAALRLAIFNLDSSQATTFKGMPTPANALAVVSIVLADHFSGSLVFTSLTGSVPVLIILTFVLSLLMVSRIPLLSLKLKDFRLKGNEGRYILLFLILASLAFLGIAAIPLIIPLYIAASLIAMAFTIPG